MLLSFSYLLNKVTKFSNIFSSSKLAKSNKIFYKKIIKNA